jgi:hypothetical protein
MMAKVIYLVEYTKYLKYSSVIDRKV